MAGRVTIRESHITPHQELCLEIVAAAPIQVWPGGDDIVIIYNSLLSETMFLIKVLVIHHLRFGRKDEGTAKLLKYINIY